MGRPNGGIARPDLCQKVTLCGERIGRGKDPLVGRGAPVAAQLDLRADPGRYTTLKL